MFDFEKIALNSKKEELGLCTKKFQGKS